MRVLITGASGFVGGRIARRLRERGDDVEAIVRRHHPALEAAGTPQRTIALTDLEGLHEALVDADAIVHAAAVAGPDLEAARAVNRDGTRAVAGAALTSSTRLVHVSTTSVYDLAAVGDTLVAENAPLVREGSPYAVTKAAAEAEVARAVGAGAVATVLRPPAVLGAGPTSTWGTRVPQLLREGGGPAGPPDATFGWVHVDDLADAVLAVLGADAEVARGAVCNVVGGHATLGDYREAVAGVVGDLPPPDAPTEPGWHGRYATDQLPALFAIEPHRTWREAFEEIAAGWPDAADDDRA